MHCDGEHVLGRVVPSEELVEIVLRAGKLGFSRQRVATALGISPQGLAAIEQHGGLTARSDPNERMSFRP